MPKATLTFNLPDEQEAYDMAIKSSNYYCALWDLFQALRAERKYGNNKWADFEEKFWEILKENGIDI